jgi:hypothetical protein
MVSIITTIVTIVIITLFSSLKDGGLIHTFNGVTMADLSGIILPSPILDYGHITDGVIRYNADTDEEPPGLKKNTYRKKIINKEFHLTEPAIIIISAFTTAKWAPNLRTDCEDNVLTQVFLNGIICAKDNSLSCRHAGSLASTAIAIRLLEPGKHSFKVEGSLTFSGDNPYIEVAVDYCLLKKTSTRGALFEKSSWHGRPIIDRSLPVAPMAETIRTTSNRLPAPHADRRKQYY